jgi:hypothetical protein
MADFGKQCGLIGVFIVAMPSFATSNQNFTARKQLVKLCQNSALLCQNSMLYCVHTLI